MKYRSRLMLMLSGCLALSSLFTTTTNASEAAKQSAIAKSAQAVASTKKLQSIYSRNKALYDSAEYKNRIAAITVQNSEFYIKDIDEALFARIKGKSYKENCVVPLEDLKYIHVLHKDINGNIHKGEMICNIYIAADVLEIMKALYDQGYPIERMQLIDDFNADDELSMESNNSSSFNYRFISHTNKVSKHGLGLAVDINTLYNPYIKQVNGKTIIEPLTAGAYVDRTKSFAYKIDTADVCYKLFTSKGFEWGGNWKSAKDYQHFELSDKTIAFLYPDNK